MKPPTVQTPMTDPNHQTKSSHSSHSSLNQQPAAIVVVRRAAAPPSEQVWVELHLVPSAEQIQTTGVGRRARPCLRRRHWRANTPRAAATGLSQGVGAWSVARFRCTRVPRLV